MSKSIHSREYKALLQIIREAREASNVSQEKIAENLGITQSQFSKLERGERRIDVLEFHRIAQAIGLSTVELVHRWVLAMEKLPPRPKS